MEHNSKHMTLPQLLHRRKTKELEIFQNLSSVLPPLLCKHWIDHPL